MIINPLYKQVTISQLRIEEQSGLSYLYIDGDQTYIYHVGAEFIESFCKTFHFSRKSINEVSLSVAFRMIKDVVKDKDYLIYINDACAFAIAIMKDDGKPVGGDLAQKLYDEMESKKCSVMGLTQDEIHTKFMVVNPNAFKMFNDRESYRLGGLLYVPHIYNGSVKIMAVIERCSSGGLAIINNRALCLYVQLRDDPKETIAEVGDAMISVAESDKLEFHQLIAERLTTNYQTTASVKECANIGQKLVTIGSGERASMIRIDKVLDHYGIASPSDRGEKWLSMQPSHLNRLQLFHLLIDAVHNEYEFMEEVGDFLFTPCDLENTGVKKLWQKPKRKQVLTPREAFPHQADRQADARDIDGDILSDGIEWDRTETEYVKGDDDIASF
jgi:hypothetical protein